MKLALARTFARRRRLSLAGVCCALSLGSPGLEAATFRRFDTPHFLQPFAVVASTDGNLWFASRNEIGRMTPSGTVTNFDLGLGVAQGDSRIHGIAVGPDGNVWFTDHDGNQVGRITPAGGVAKYQLPGDVFEGGPSGIAAGPDGALWFTLGFADRIGRITTDGQITEFPLPPDPLGGSLRPASICAGPDGALWFVEERVYEPHIGRITTAGVVTTFPLPATSFPQPPASYWTLGAVTAGPDGNVWFTGVDTTHAGGSIARITPAGVVTSFPTVFRPTGLTPGPDGDLWFTAGDNLVGKITTAGAMTSYPVSTFGGTPAGITSGPGGMLWFADYGLSRIVSLTTAGATTPFPVGSSNPQGIAFGPDGNVWFTEHYGKIARLTPGLVFTEFVLPDIEFHPSAIVAGADGNLWFLEATVSLDRTMIGRITPAGVITEFSLPPGISAFGLTAGPGGNVWFTENNITAGGSTARGVASITPAGQITEFPVPGGGAAFYNIMAGGDGNLWFDTYGGKLVRMTPQGVATTFAVPGAPASFSGFVWGPDGNIWITTFDRLFRYQPGVAATPFTIPTPNADARQIVSTSTDLWFPEFQGSRLARISTAGVFTEFPIPGPYPYPVPSFLCVGAGGDMWLTEPNANRVWRFQITEPTSFATLPPCRVLDTRSPDGPVGGPVLAAGASRDFAVAGACGVPAGAISISTNVTVVGATGAGFVGVHAGGGVDPQTPTVSVARAGARANNALIQLSTDGTGRITVANHTTGTVHVILDVNGFFR